MTGVKVLRGGVLKSGDTAPALRVQLFTEDENPANVSSESQSITIERSDSDSPVIDSASMTTVDAESGVVEYDWQPGDTGDAGIYEAEVKSTDGTDTTSYPNDHFFRIHIMEGL